MWALRSLPRRAHTLLSSRRYASQLSAVLGSSSLIRGYASNSNDNSHAEVSQQHLGAATKRHLYVVLDDHKDGYGIHKLDLDDGLEDEARRLPGPPVLRVVFPAVGDGAQFASVGGFSIQQYEDEVVGSAFMYDTETSVMVASAQIPRGLFYSYDAAMAFGQRLYMLESDELEFAHRVVNAFPGGLHCLVADGGGDKDLWLWKQPMSPSSRWCWSDYLMLPFLAYQITCHAVHAPPC